MEEADFQTYLSGIYQNGLLMLSMAFGHKLGLFKFLTESRKPLGLTDIADGLELKERYTKEWLSSMVAAGIVHQDRDSSTYSIPESHKPALRKIASFAPVLLVCSQRTDKLLQCFKKDGPYGISFQDSQEWFDWFCDYRSTMCEDAVDKVIIPLISNQDNVITKLEAGIRVLDVGSGSGNYTNALAKKFPNSSFVGLDNADRGIELSNETKATTGLTNVEFVRGDAHDLPEEWTEKFDFVLVYDTLHDLSNPHKALDEIYRVLKQDGYVSVVELCFQSNPADNANNKYAAMYYTISMFICLASSMADEPHVGYGACWGVENVEKALRKARFKFNGNSSYVTMGKKAVFFCTK